MPAKRDYYEVLGVARDASEDEIRRAFRRLARQYHPDVNKEPDADQRFKVVNEAYEVLSNAERRQVYDRFGHDAPQGQPFGSGMGGFSTFGGFEDIFETFFGSGMGGGTRRGQRGNDLRYQLNLTFEEAVNGVEKSIEIPRMQACPRCNGGGGEPGTQPIRCPTCNGTGEVRRVQQSIFGRFVNVTVCDRCHGEGQINPTPCQQCRGQRRVETVRRLNVTIPAGVDDGQQIRLSGEGEMGSAPNQYGDLYVFITVAPHRVFKRQGTDLIYDLAINVAQAALGDEVDVPLVDGTTARMKVPSGTQSGRVLRMRDKGVPNLRGGARGDLVVRVKVTIPERLTAEQRELFSQLAMSFDSGSREREGASARTNGTGRDGASDQGDRRKDKGLFDKVKDVFGGE